MLRFQKSDFYHHHQIESGQWVRRTGIEPSEFVMIGTGTQCLQRLKMPFKLPRKFLDRYLWEPTENNLRRLNPKREHHEHFEP